jgi:hypothetical protein
MQIVIEIPKEFEEYFNSDRFEDILQRVRVDIHKSIISGRFVLSGNREKEALDMLTDAFLNSEPLPKGHGRLVDLDNIEEQLERYGKKSVYYQLPYSPTIIESDKEGDSE